MHARATLGSNATASEPKISALIPTFNYGRFLPEAIESVLAQDCRGCEILINDDASTDDSAAILRRYAACAEGPPGLIDAKAVAVADR